jgi:hypothetical protein
LRRPAWAILLLCIVAIHVFRLVDVEARRCVPDPDGYLPLESRPGGERMWWHGVMTSTATLGATSSTIKSEYLPPEDAFADFVRPYAELSLEASLTTAQGTWIAPHGTPQAEYMERANAGGLFRPGGVSMLELPGKSGQVLFGLAPGEFPSIGVHRRIVWKAVLFDLVHFVARFGIPLVALLALGRMIVADPGEQRALRLAMGLCPRCRYDRGGIATDAVCPECGEAGDSPSTATFQS